MTAFKELKSLLRNDLQLTIFDPNPPTILPSDAYNIDLGACLSQIARGRLVPIAFASNTFTNQERVYAMNQPEALGCVSACEHISNFLLG
uniref:Reverse transcriptase/retrotransposon-derived protein RNase H-like domain-containing protein n=1 Tax=Romanomermis culicivorax TaxID=13658 RepID=A0A915L754_ROMCU